MQYGLIGEHLSHSFSKPIHESFGEYQYELKEIEKEKIHDFFRSKDFKAINITIPYKNVAYAHCDHIDDQARSVGACNCVVNKDDILYGHNTDYDGISYTLDLYKVDVENKTVLILGKGGASKAFQAVMKDRKAKDIQVVYYKEDPHCITYEQAYRQYSHAEILINATPVGMSPHIDSCPVSLENFPNLEFVFDAIYNPLRTRLLQQAKQRNIRYSNGLPMLVAQAKYAAEYFLDRSIKTDMTALIQSVQNQFENLVFIGMPSSGKTTISKKIADLLQKEWLDIDQEIEKEAKISIQEIFSQSGEKAFRDRETSVTLSIAKKTGCVIACGGGIITRDINMQALNQNGYIIYLKRPLDQLIQKDDSRPKLKEGIQNLYDQRKDLYERYADCIIDNDQDIDTTIQSCIYKLNERKKTI